MVIQLTKEEMDKGYALGSERWTESRKIGLKTDSSGSMIDVYGSWGEIACARAFQVGFDGNLNSFKNPDLYGTNYQVRTTIYKTGRLIIKKNDNPKHRYILVRWLGKNEFDVVGWVYGTEGMRLAKTEIINGKPLNFVASENLRPPELLVTKHYFEVRL